MGQGRKRKVNDITRIKRPKAAVASNGADAADEQIDTCKPSFEVKIKEENFIVAGMRVHLSRIDETTAMQVNGTTVGYLTKKNAQMIRQCAEVGFKYFGTVIEKGKEKYARFIRTTD